jgi:hypothetical protein
MDEAQVDDLKQFIATTISQQTSDMPTKEDLHSLKDDLRKVSDKMSTKEDLHSVSDKLSGKIDDLDLKVDTIAVTLNETLIEHDLRLKKFEQQAA